MTDIKQKKENVKMHLKDLRQNLKKMHLEVTEELILPKSGDVKDLICLLYTSPSPRDPKISRMPSSA